MNKISARIAEENQWNYEAISLSNFSFNLLLNMYVWVWGFIPKEEKIRAKFSSWTLKKKTLLVFQMMIAEDKFQQKKKEICRIREKYIKDM